MARPAPKGSCSHRRQPPRRSYGQQRAVGWRIPRWQLPPCPRRRRPRRPPYQTPVAAAATNVHHQPRSCPIPHRSHRQARSTANARGLLATDHRRPKPSRLIARGLAAGLTSPPRELRRASRYRVPVSLPGLTGGRLLSTFPAPNCCDNGVSKGVFTARQMPLTTSG